MCSEPARPEPVSASVGGEDAPALSSVLYGKLNAMNATHLLTLAGKLAAAEISAEEFLREAALITAQTDAATVDLDRERRCGFPEVIFGTGKTVEAIIAIATRLLEHGQNVFATRIDADKALLIVERLPGAIYNPVARTLRIDRAGRNASIGHVAVITAGTSDLPVAEEARETLAWMGVRATMVHDVGVAGPHRLPARLAEFADSDAIVVVAGMEGALPSVVGGYVPCPVFAVPTSVGYGANLGGLAALLAMLNSCASNVAVVNIDAGFKAGYLAGLVATRRGSSGS
jgi:pyridinium-3,5-biscarboxylic acid mononucleotide synthase